MISLVSGVLLSRYRSHFNVAQLASLMSVHLSMNVLLVPVDPSLGLSLVPGHLSMDVSLIPVNLFKDVRVTDAKPPLYGRVAGTRCVPSSVDVS